jgi:hypothetical protein
MKKLLTLALVTISIAHAHEHEHGESVLNKSPAVLAGITSIEEFKASFEARGATLGAELVGFKSKLVEEEAESAHCHTLGDSEARNYVAAAGSFSTEEFKEAAESSVALFERAFGDPKKIQEAKFWRSNIENEANIQVKYVWKQDNGELATNHFYCHKHQHGEELEIDCHRQRLAGPFQP